MRLRSASFPATPAARRRRDRILAVLGVLALLFLVGKSARKEAGVIVHNQEFGARFLAGEDPYDDPALGHRVHEPYPPSYALVCAPLSLLPLPVARVVWTLTQGAALFVLYRLLRRRLALLWPAVAPHAPVLYAGALLLVSRYLLRDMAAGGGNLLYLTLAMAGLELALSGRRWRAGLPIALGLVVKPSLAPLLLFYAARGRWRTLVASLAVAAVLFVLPGAYYGMARYGELAHRWSADVLRFATLDDLHDASMVPEGLPPPRAAMNQSLREAIHRLLRPPGDTGARDVHLVTTSPATAAWCARLLSLALVTAGLVVAGRARSGRAEWLAALTFLPLACLLSPITWKAHCVVLLPLFFVLLAVVRDDPRLRPLLAFLVVYYLACDLLSEEIVGKGAKNDLQALSIVTWGSLALFVVGLGTVRRLGRAQDVPDAPP